LKTEETKKQLQTRLRRIEGQVKGIEKMINEDACCKDVLIQVAAVRAAVNKVGSIILENYAKECVSRNSEPENKNQEVENLVDALIMFMK
jgi:CsoR family transcriptional regulator, copper-sensing transcriptional repressor